MKRCFLLLFLPVVLFMLGACSEKEEPNPEYANWAARNDAAFADSLRTARNAIAQARAKWGDAWEQHCDWRVLRNYIIGPNAKADSRDSVVVHCLHHGTGSGSSPPPTTQRAISSTIRARRPIRHASSTRCSPKPTNLQSKVWYPASARHCNPCASATAGA